MVTDVPLIAILLYALFALTRPVQLQCPPGYFVEGVRPTGASRCLEDMPGGPDCRGARACTDERVQRELPLQIYCTGGTCPIVGRDGRTIGCQRRYGGCE